MGKKGQPGDNDGATAEDLVKEKESNRIKERAFRMGVISRDKSSTASKLKASKTLLKSDGKDIVKKGHRKNKYLFAFPGLMAPMNGGKLGDLAQLDSKNPVLYIDFPKGRMKLFGTIVYPKNKYLTLSLSKGSGNIICEDCFESLVVFSEALWIGTAEENPEEKKLPLPEDLAKDRIHAEVDFTGGAGRGLEKPKPPTIQKPEAVQVAVGGGLSTPKGAVGGGEGGAGEEGGEGTTGGKAEAGPSRTSRRTSAKRVNYADFDRDSSPERGGGSSSSTSSDEEKRGGGGEDDESMGADGDGDDDRARPSDAPQRKGGDAGRHVATATTTSKASPILLDSDDEDMSEGEGGKKAVGGGGGGISGSKAGVVGTGPEAKASQHAKSASSAGQAGGGPKKNLKQVNLAPFFKKPAKGDDED